jgi:hypothetical protein
VPGSRAVPDWSRRLAAVVALFAPVGALAIALSGVATNPGWALSSFACLLVALGSTWTWLTRRGLRVGSARHGVVIVNTKSGGGKAERFDLAGEAARRGVRAIVLQPDDDLGKLAEQAIAGGADVIGMAGGDGSQAVVATAAMRHGIPHVCIPSGTRNHLALDLELTTLETIGQARRYPGLLEWSGAEFEVRSGAPVAVGLDGEALLLDPPLRFSCLPGALRVRLPRRASGISPAAAAVSLTRADAAALYHVAAGRPPYQTDQVEVAAAPASLEAEDAQGGASRDAGRADDRARRPGPQTRDQLVSLRPLRLRGRLRHRRRPGGTHPGSRARPARPRRRLVARTRRRPPPHRGHRPRLHRHRHRPDHQAPPALSEGHPGGGHAGSRRRMVVTRSMALSNEATTPTPERSACATR